MRATTWCLAALAALLAAAAQEHEAEEEVVSFDEEDARWNRGRREMEEEDEWAPPPRERRDLRYELRSCCEYDQPIYRTRRSAGHYEVKEDTGEEPQQTAPLFHPDQEMAGAASEQAAHGFHPDRHRMYNTHQKEHVRYAVRPKKHRSYQNADLRQPFGAHSEPKAAYAAHPFEQAHDHFDNNQHINNAPDEESPFVHKGEDNPHVAYEPQLHDKYQKQKYRERYPGKPKAHPYIPEKELRASHFEKRPELRPEVNHNEDFHHNMEPGAPPPAHYLPPHDRIPVEEDQDPEGTNNHAKQSGHSQAYGSGQSHRGQHRSLNNAHGAKGYKSYEHGDKGSAGHKTKQLHKNQFEEAEGQKKQHHDNAAHHADHEEQAHGQKGAKFDEQKGHKKGHKTKGYHNKYHKDEFHKEHKFYDDYHKGGSHHRYGKFHAKHASSEAGKKKAHRVDAAHDAAHKGAKGYSNKGHIDSDHRGHKGKQGHEEHRAHHEAYGKKGGGGDGAKWSYKHN